MKKVYFQYFAIAAIVLALLLLDRSGSFKDTMLYICFFTGLWNFLLELNGKK